MRTEITICDWCRSDSTIRAAVAYYWNPRWGRMFDVCYEHMNMMLQPGRAMGLFLHPGATDEPIFDLPNLGIFHETPEVE